MLHKAVSKIAILAILTCSALFLCQCSSSTDPADPAGPEVPADWAGWEDDLDFSGGQTFYLDPVDGLPDNPGTRAEPLGSLAEVLANDLIQRYEAVSHPYVEGAELVLVNPEAPIQPGDTLILLDGDHGQCSLVESHSSEFITIRAENGHRPLLSGLELVGVERYRVQGLTIRGTDLSALVDIESHGWRGPCRYVIIEDCDIASLDDATVWSATDWDELASSGISASGDYISLRNNQLLNVNFGVSASGNFFIVENNVIENFCGDGLRGIGNDMIFQYNTVKNCYDVNENHDDGFQSWSINGQPPRERIVLRGNVIIGYEDPDQPLRGTLQGIGCFDGMYIDWIVENNIVATDHWHGITFLGAQGCRIVNNSVIDLNDVDPGPPWVMIGPHKDGRLSSACVIRNNIAASISASDGVLEDHNLETTDYAAHFVDPANLDLRLRADSEAVDTGSMEMAPIRDIAGNARPLGSGVDLGAYER